MEGLDSLHFENSFTKALDEALIEKQLIMLEGLTGSGKTASVKDWLEHHSEINGIYIDAATLPEPVGMITEHDDLFLSGQLFSSEMIDSIKNSESVVVIDNYHLVNDSAKQHILLLCDGYVIDERNPNGIDKLEKLDFVCVVKTNI